MPHLTASDIPLPSCGCDPHRITAEGWGDVTSAVRPSPGLLVGRYLHTPSSDYRRVSIALAGNGSQPVSNSPARPAVERIPAGPEHAWRGSGWLAADLTVSSGDLAVGGFVAGKRPDENMTKLPATNRADRSAISMARPASADIGVAEVHDSITGAVPISYEDDGFPETTAVPALTILEGPIADGS